MINQNQNQAIAAELQELKLKALREAIQVGIDDIAKGDFSDYTVADLGDLVDEICRDGRRAIGQA